MPMRQIEQTECLSVYSKVIAIIRAVTAYGCSYIATHSPVDDVPQYGLSMADG